MAKVHFTVSCIATYESELPIPKDKQMIKMQFLRIYMKI